MSDYVDYIIETSNSDFLEAIEAISRSHKEHIPDIETSLSDKSCNLECDELKFYNKKYSTALKDDDSDCLNLTDCDLNFMVDPRTGRGLYDEDSFLKDFQSECLKNDLDEPLIKDNPNENVMIKIEVKTENEYSYEADEKLVNKMLGFENQSTPKGNKLVFIQMTNSPNNCEKVKKNESYVSVKSHSNSEKYGKPPFSYSCLIAMALKNSETGYLPVSEIYNFIIDRFPYFKTAPDGWKNSIRHNLSLNKCFQKLETPLTNGTSRKACLWGLNETKVKRLDEEISKWIGIENECIETLRFDTRDLDDTEQDDFCGSPPPNKILKEMKREVSTVDIKSIHIKMEKVKEFSSESLLTDSEEQIWDDFEIDRLKPAPYFYFSNEGSQSAFDSALSFKTVRASA